jgi:hypothetical protein
VTTLGPQADGTLRVPFAVHTEDGHGDGVRTVGPGDPSWPIWHEWFAVRAAGPPVGDVWAVTGMIPDTYAQVKLAWRDGIDGWDPDALDWAIQAAGEGLVQLDDGPGLHAWLLGQGFTDTALSGGTVAAMRAAWQEAEHPRVLHGEHGGQFAHKAAGAARLVSAATTTGGAGEDEAVGFLTRGVPTGAVAESLPTLREVVDRGAALKAATAERLAVAMKSSTADLVAACKDRDAGLTDAWEHRDDPDWLICLDGNSGWAQAVKGWGRLTVKDDLDQVMAKMKVEGRTAFARGGSPEVDGTLRRAATGYMVRQWALSASDDEIMSRAIQEAARREFGLDAAKLPRCRVGGTAGYVRAALAEHEGVFRDFIRAEYDLTQADLAAAGITALRLHRGFSWNWIREDVPEWAQSEGVKPVPPLRPLSSWSAVEGLADGYAANRAYGAAHSGVIVSASIPADRVVACPRTGAGALSEAEFIVMALPGECQVRRERGWP